MSREWEHYTDSSLLSHTSHDLCEGGWDADVFNNGLVRVFYGDCAREEHVLDIQYKNKKEALLDISNLFEVSISKRELRKACRKYTSADLVYVWLMRLMCISIAGVLAALVLSIVGVIS